MVVSKSIVADLNQWEKLTEINFMISGIVKCSFSLRNKICWQPLHNLCRSLSQVTAQHRRDQEAYQSYKNKDRVVRIVLLSSMRNDLLLCFVRYRTTKEVWDAVRLQYGGTSTTRPRSLNLRFDGYKKRHDHSMRKHLTVVSNMIAELSTAGRELSDEDQVQVVIRSLPNKTWEHMCVNLTHNDSELIDHDL